MADSISVKAWSRKYPIDCFGDMAFWIHNNNYEYFLFFELLFWEEMGVMYIINHFGDTYIEKNQVQNHEWCENLASNTCLMDQLLDIMLELNPNIESIKVLEKNTPLPKERRSFQIFNDIEKKITNYQNCAFTYNQGLFSDMHGSILKTFGHATFSL